MARNPKKGNKNKKITVKVRNLNGGGRRTLDSNALAYARLIADPCNAPMVRPIYPGGDSGILVRSEAFTTFGTAPSATAGVFHWVPGYLNSNQTQLIGMQAVGPEVGQTTGTLAGTPGWLIMQGIASGVRCVAACLKITYPGNESARSGRIHYGITKASLVDNATSIRADDVAQSLQHYSRTPADTIELFWKPDAGDFEFTDPNEVASPVIRDRKSALTVAFAGLPAAVGLTFHLTAVYEFTPKIGQGLAHNALGKAQSRNSIDDVMDYLISSGFTFVRHAGEMMQSYANNNPAFIANVVTSMFGNMAARGRTRNPRLITG